MGHEKKILWFWIGGFSLRQRFSNFIFFALFPHHLAQQLQLFGLFGRRGQRHQPLLQRLRLAQNPRGFILVIPEFRAGLQRLQSGLLIQQGRVVKDPP